MKNLKKTIVGALSVLFFVGTTQVAYANENIEFEQLKNDIKIINEVEESQLQEYYIENEEWILEVNERLDEYLESISDEEKIVVMAKLEGINPNSRSSTSRFEWHRFEKRSGYWTYSMVPKASTRILKAYATEGYNELNNYYGSFGTSSIKDQYWCHYQARIESEWNLEQGRPDVGLTNTILALCNP